MNIVSLRRARFCEICGITFSPRHASHRYCAMCVRWHFIGHNIARVRRALRNAT